MGITANKTAVRHKFHMLEFHIGMRGLSCGFKLIPQAHDLSAALAQ